MPDAQPEKKETDDRAALRDMATRSRRGEYFAIVASGFAGALSLAVATYNVYLQRQQVRAQVWPSIALLSSDVEDLEYYVENSGVGPARILGARVSIDGTDVKSWHDVLAYIDAHDASAGKDFRRVHSTLVGRVIPPGGTIVTMKFEAIEGNGPDEKGHRARQLEQVLDKLRMEVCYCSSLDDCWITRGFDAVPVAECPRARLTFDD